VQIADAIVAGHGLMPGPTFIDQRPRTEATTPPVTPMQTVARRRAARADKHRQRQCRVPDYPDRLRISARAEAGRVILGYWCGWRNLDCVTPDVARPVQGEDIEHGVALDEPSGRDEDGMPSVERTETANHNDERSRCRRAASTALRGFIRRPLPAAAATAVAHSPACSADRR